MRKKYLALAIALCMCAPTALVGCDKDNTSATEAAEVSKPKAKDVKKVLSAIEEDFDADDELYPFLEKVLRDALANFTKAREVEGENLKQDMLDKLNRMTELVQIIDDMSPRIVEEYKQKLMDRIAELMEGREVDEARVMTEVTIYADKIAVDEEITRLRSHVSSSIDILEKGGAVGRKMDFIIQEMNREANTILSKSDSLKVTDIGIELKTIIEKIREQVQNIE